MGEILDMVRMLNVSRLLELGVTGWIVQIIDIIEICIVIGLTTRIVMKHRPVGVSLAWLVLIFASPIVAFIFYFLIGEVYISRRTIKRLERFLMFRSDWLDDLKDRSYTTPNWNVPAFASITQLAESTTGVPPLAGNCVDLLPDSDTGLLRLLDDINAAERKVHLQFYIWQVGERPNQISEALMDAAQRGVECKVLVDAVESRHFTASQIAERMQEAGVEIRAALPVGLIRRGLARVDLRMHRKVAVIDDHLGYIGSLNIIEPRTFKKKWGVGMWVDSIARLRGPAVEVLAMSFQRDWEILSEHGETEEDVIADVTPLDPCGEGVVQIVPSGPLSENDAIYRLIMMLIYAAEREITITSPYFIPDEFLSTALKSAVSRGIDVRLVVPDKIDSMLVRNASRSYERELLAGGIKIFRYEAGLLHTKSITIDDRISLFGSHNIDPRSLKLNFELSILVFDTGFNRDLVALQERYLENSRHMHLDECDARPLRIRFLENVFRLFQPLI